MNPISANLSHFRQLIITHEVTRGVPLQSIHLIAASKGQPIEKLRAAYAAGQREFAENYVQEALAKMQALPMTDCIWHFIGRIQTNKTALLAKHFSWVQSVARPSDAARLSAQRPADLPPLNVLVSVNLDVEPSKSGVTEAQLPKLANAIEQLPHLKLRGLMVIPAPQTDYAKQLATFQHAKRLFTALCDEGHPLDTLSMGMSQDYQAALAAGSTMLRIGTGIFGERS
jgi:pyridoxal phosphate enzyme (YggS family)